MTKSELIAEIVDQGMVDDILKDLITISLEEKRRIRMRSQERKNRLKAIEKIANYTRDLEAIKAMAKDE